MVKCIETLDSIIAQPALSHIGYVVAISSRTEHGRTMHDIDRRNDSGTVGNNHGIHETQGKTACLLHTLVFNSVCSACSVVQDRFYDETSKGHSIYLGG